MSDKNFTPENEFEEDIEYICDGCGEIISEEEYNMFSGQCEECNLSEPTF